MYKANEESEESSTDTNLLHLNRFADEPNGQPFHSVSHSENKRSSLGQEALRLTKIPSQQVCTDEQPSLFLEQNKFDLNQEGREVLRGAVPRQSPIDTVPVPSPFSNSETRVRERVVEIQEESAETSRRHKRNLLLGNKNASSEDPKEHSSAERLSRSSSMSNQGMIRVFPVEDTRKQVSKPLHKESLDNLSPQHHLVYDNRTPSFKGSGIPAKKIEELMEDDSPATQQKRPSVVEPPSPSTGNSMSTKFRKLQKKWGTTEIGKQTESFLNLPLVNNYEESESIRREDSSSRGQPAEEFSSSFETDNSKAAENFELDDLESLQEAHIDSHLLEHHFLNLQQKNASQSRDILVKHSKIFGYLKIPKAKIPRRKQAMRNRRSRIFNEVLRQFDSEISELQQQIAYVSKLEDEEENRAALLELQSKLKQAQIKRSESVHKHKKLQESSEDLSKIQFDHEYCDIMFAELMHQQVAQKRQNSKRIEKKMRARLKETQRKSTHEEEIAEKMKEIRHQVENQIKDIQVIHDSKNIRSHREVQAKYTIQQDTPMYSVWHFLVILNCFYSSIMYPYYTMNDFPTSFHLLYIVEGFFAIDIGLNFFKQELDEQGCSKFEPLSVVAQKYLLSKFPVDLIAFLPIGLMSSMIDERLKFLWVIKAIRIGQLNYYLRDRMLMPVIRHFIEQRQLTYLNDEQLREDMNQDHVFLKQKIYITNIVKTTRLICQIMFIAFFLGQYWFIFSQTVHEFLFHEASMADFIKEAATNTSKDFQSFISNADTWSLIEEAKSNTDRVTISMYFAFTTLSTVGFGDYYPVNDIERLCGSFFLLFGVAVFSYTMGELLASISKMKHLGQEFNQDEELEKFFLLLRKFNDGKPMDKDLQAQILAFMNFKWVSDRNNFLLEDKDRQIFSQLPGNVQRQIFTDFIFQEFLYKFRRFFSFRTDLLNPRKKKQQADEELTQLSNSHISHLRSKVNTVMNVGGRKSMKPMSKQEISQLTQNLRKRVQEFEAKQKEEKAKVKAQVEERKRLEYWEKPNLKFPFFTFQNDLYSEFMTDVMQSLEIRQFEPRDLIAKELEECVEVFFVVKGKYKVGYEVNKTRYMRLKFGQSTIIGGFNISFERRFLFCYQAHSQMECYSIRKPNWRRIMGDYPAFQRMIRQKLFTFYFGQIYQPLMKMKSEDVEFFERRKDYFQVLVLINNKSDEMRRCMNEIFLEVEKTEEKFGLAALDQSKMWWLIKIIELKLDTLIELSLELTFRIETLQRILWSRVVEAIALDKVDDSKQLQKELHTVVFSIEFMAKLRLQMYASQVNTKYRQIEFEMKKFAKNSCIFSDVKNRIKTRFAETFIRHPLLSKHKSSTEKLKDLRVEEIRPSLRTKWIKQEIGAFGSQESPNSCQLPKVSFSKEEVARYLEDDHSATINESIRLRDNTGFDPSHSYSERGRQRKSAMSSKSQLGHLQKVEEEEPIQIDEQMMGAPLPPSILVQSGSMVHNGAHQPVFVVPSHTVKRNQHQFNLQMVPLYTNSPDVSFHNTQRSPQKRTKRKSNFAMGAEQSQWTNRSPPQRGQHPELDEPRSQIRTKTYNIDEPSEFATDENEDRITFHQLEHTMKNQPGEKEEVIKGELFLPDFDEESIGQPLESAIHESSSI